jgi:hypothetical protein
VKFLKTITALRSLAPYAAIEFLLPGGSLIALAVWFFRRTRKAQRPTRVSVNAPVIPPIEEFGALLPAGSVGHV